MKTQQVTLRDKWLTALRTPGLYRQVRGHFHCDGGFCAMGVLYDVATNGTWLSASRSPRELYGGDPEGECGITLDMRTAIMKMNDDMEYSFKDIADLLESWFVREELTDQ